MLQKKNIRGLVFMFGYCNNLKIKKIFINEFHSSVCLFSEKELNKGLEKRIENLKKINIDEDINDISKINLNKSDVDSLREGLSKLKTRIPDNDVSDSISSISESFPWLINNEGNNIDFTTNIDLFDGVKLVAQYLEKKFDVNNITDVKITEILKPLFDINEGEGITVLDLYDHISTLFNKGEFKETILKGITNEVNNKSLSDTLGSSKPLGEFGEISLNEVVTQIKDLK